MSVSNPTQIDAAESSEAVYGDGEGRGDLERHVLETIRLWLVSYVADYERKHLLVPRSTPIPTASQSIHGGVDYETFSSELFPEVIVVCVPFGTAERLDGDGTYGQWFDVGVAAFVTAEGDQDQARRLADIYGTVLQKLLPQKGGFGLQSDEVTPFATRTRLQSAYGLEFPNNQVRDIVRATVQLRTYVSFLVTDYDGPSEPPLDPYAPPLPPPQATRVEVGIVRGTPDTSGSVVADGFILDGTVYPPVVEFEELVVDEPPDTIPGSED